ncbi:MAG TPA: hypothetical protein PK191_05420 [Niabella sp.]|nr:hypothetical protein [Niabella sp.]HOZ97517.1 hypothetical protein [Niabella sp.]HQW15605.1 hypothetical protein [Niabella sp.]HQX20748.1 hypothetical protein [Niabella sp.]HQX41347.1 hypothetical protein [Niabella sp.]
MIQEKINAAYEILTEKDNELIEHNPHNACYDKLNTLQLLPDTKEKMVLVAASGHGKYAEILIDRMAIVTGFELAIIRIKKKGKFFAHGLSDNSSMIKDNSCANVLCALAFH